MKRMLALLLCVALVGLCFTVGCEEKKGPLQEAGKNADDAMKNAKDAVDDVEAPKVPETPEAPKAPETPAE